MQIKKRERRNDRDHEIIISTLLIKNEAGSVDTYAPHFPTSTRIVLVK
jgi:hypothetical protein